MSRYWPHPPYAEDQPLAHTILTTHVLTRGFQAGSAIGLILGGTTYTLQRFSILRQPSPPRTLLITLLRGIGSSSLAGTGFLAVGLTMRMFGQEEIEWKDRAWRLCENEGQMSLDDSTYAWMGVGAASAAAMGMSKTGQSLAAASGWRGRVGLVGIGGMVGAADSTVRKALTGRTEDTEKEEGKL